jgi:hypothetical protein
MAYTIKKKKDKFLIFLVLLGFELRDLHLLYYLSHASSPEKRQI